MGEKMTWLLIRTIDGNGDRSQALYTGSLVDIATLSPHPQCAVVLTSAATTAPTCTHITFAIDTRDSCYRYFDASLMQTDISGTSFCHQCDLAAAVFGMELSELLNLEPRTGQ